MCLERNAAGCLALALAAGCGGVPVAAGTPAPPPAVIAAVTAELAEYSGTGSADARWRDGAARAVDVSPDGVDDWLIDFEVFGFPAWCGTGGCRRQLWVSQQDRHVLVFDAHTLEFDLRAGASGDIDVELHGVYCGGTGGTECPRSFTWNAEGSRLDEIPNRSGDTLLSGPLFQPIPVDETTLPAGVAAARHAVRQSCAAANGTYEEYDALYASVPDLDGDGRRDWIVDGSRAACESDAGVVTQSPIRIFLSGGGRVTESTPLPGDEYEIDIAHRPAQLRPRPARE